MMARAMRVIFYGASGTIARRLRGAIWVVPSTPAPRTPPLVLSE